MSTLFLEASGQITPAENLIDLEEEDLYSIFNARAEFMGWSSTSLPRPNRPLLWGMQEAELTAGTGDSRIGWVQVGLNVGPFEPNPDWTPPTQPGWASLPVRRRSIDPAMAMPALVQCFDDALRRFGAIELSALQVMAINLDPGPRSGADNLISALNWFNTKQQPKADAMISFDQEMLGGHTEAELVASLQHRNSGRFKFGPVVTVPEHHSIKAPFPEGPYRSFSPAHSGRGVSVTLPEWTASAAAWALATIIDTSRPIAPDVRNFALRITRVR